MSPFDIRSARQVGKLLRCSREAQQTNLQHISKQCGLSVALLVHIESGNLYVFDSSLQKLMSYSNVYAQALNVDVNALGTAISLEPLTDLEVPVDDHIPHFLMKQT